MALESYCNLICINNSLLTALLIILINISINIFINILTNIVKDIEHASTTFDTMRFNILPMVAIAATLPSVSLSAPTDSVGISARDNTAAIIGTWDDKQCGISKVDDSVAVPDNRPTGNCKELRGNSMQVFWVKKGCVVLLFKNRGCKTDPTPATSLANGWNQCFDNSRYVSWTTYCA